VIKNENDLNSNTNVNIHARRKEEREDIETIEERMEKNKRDRNCDKYCEFNTT
jgi:hypothetical protein